MIFKTLRHRGSLLAGGDPLYAQIRYYEVQGIYTLKAGPIPQLLPADTTIEKIEKEYYGAVDSYGNGLTMRLLRDYELVLVTVSFTSE